MGKDYSGEKKMTRGNKIEQNRILGDEGYERFY